MNSEAHYCARRAGEERTAAIRATHPNAKRVHKKLADAYELRLRALTSNPVKSVRSPAAAAVIPIRAPASGRSLDRPDQPLLVLRVSRE